MTKRTYQAMYRGVLYDGDYDLDRSDILSILGPTLDEFFGEMESDGIVPATLTVLDCAAHAYDIESPEPYRFDIPQRMHLALLDRQMAPERETPPHVPAVTDEERATWHAIWDLNHGANAVPGVMYLNPYDFPVVRKIDSVFVEFETHIEVMKHRGLYAFVLDSEMGRSRPLLVAAEVPRGYAYIPPEPDDALMPLCTRAKGAVPKIVPKYLYLLDP